jgi:type IV pilus assembly protein PilV
MIDLSSHRMRGFTLLEVLVALVILSIGVLGLAAMQASALSSTHGSQLESMVVIQARSLADAMNANPVYWGNNTPNFTVSAGAGGTPTAPNLVFTGTPPTNTSGTQCNNVCQASDLAGYDVNQWAAQLLTQVPTANAQIACTASAPYGCSITITWTENSAAAINSGTANKASAATTNMSYTLVNQIEP